VLRDCLLFLTILTLSGDFIGADESVESPRRTPLVKVIQSIEPAVVALFTPMADQLISGSGTVIHEDGYVLTNNHVLPATEGFALLPNMGPIRFRVVGRVPESDIAIVRLITMKKPLAVVPLGRSADLMNGETVVVAGNPGGRGTVYTSGIVSSKSVLEGGPNALVMTNYENSRRDDFIQFDAASNRGNSGGPLVNMDGRVIGIVSAVVNGEQNVGLAIPIDRVFRQFEQMLEPELYHQKLTGLKIQPLASGAIVQSVQEGSPAASAGMLAGDIIQSVNGVPLRNIADWIISLDELLPASEPLNLTVQRGAENLTVKVQPQELPAIPAVEVPSAEPGLKYSFHHGKFNQMPDFSSIPTERSGVIPSLGVQLKEVNQTREDYFAIRFEGYLKVKSDGLYRLILVSDDGSRLFLHDKLTIDHDGNHPPKPASRVVRLKSGLHPLTIEFFQGNGDKRLELFIEECDNRESVSLKPIREVTADEFLHDATEK
jgi:S1-C subfamily serine protease